MDEARARLNAVEKGFAAMPVSPSLALHVAPVPSCAVAENLHQLRSQISAGNRYPQLRSVCELMNAAGRLVAMRSSCSALLGSTYCS